MEVGGMRAKSILAALVVPFAATVSSADLHDRGGGLIYDDVLNITWLQDASYAETTGYDSAGGMSWSQAMAWADQLVYAGYDDWRLPKTTDSCGIQYGYDGTTTYGYNVITSEMGFMYYVNLCNSGRYDLQGNEPASWGLSNTGPFINLSPSYFWSSTILSDNPYEFYLFYFFEGQQTFCSDAYPARAWAVRDGDVSVVPVPGAALLGVLGLGVAGMRLRRGA